MSEEREVIARRGKWLKGEKVGKEREVGEVGEEREVKVRSGGRWEGE